MPRCCLWIAEFVVRRISSLRKESKMSSISQPKYAKGSTVYNSNDPQVVTDMFYDFPSNQWHYFLGDEERPYPETSLINTPPPTEARILEVADYVAMALKRNELVGV